MGIIFRNGIPFGAAEDDVTTVYAYEDLFDLTDKKENHLYIVEETNIPYRYDIETERFYPLGADVPPIISERDEIIVGNGSNWAKGNGHKYYVVYSNGNQENIVGSLLDMPVAFGGLAVPIAGQTAPTLKNGYKAQDNAIADISGNARLYMGENSRIAVHDNAWIDVKRSSIIEITDNSELRMWDGICIYARYNPQTNEPTIEFVNRYGTNGTDMDETNVATGDNKEPLDRVSFTFDQLKAIKALLDQPKLMQLTESEYDSLEYKDPNTVYVVGEDSEPNSGEG